MKNYEKVLLVLGMPSILTFTGVRMIMDAEDDKDKINQLRVNCYFSLFWNNALEGVVNKIIEDPILNLCNGNDALDDGNDRLERVVNEIIGDQILSDDQRRNVLGQLQDLCDGNDVFKEIINSKMLDYSELSSMIRTAKLITEKRCNDAYQENETFDYVTNYAFGVLTLVCGMYVFRASLISVAEGDMLQQQLEGLQTAHDARGQQLDNFRRENNATRRQLTRTLGELGSYLDREDILKFRPIDTKSSKCETFDKRCIIVFVKDMLKDVPRPSFGEISLSIEDAIREQQSSSSSDRRPSSSTRITDFEPSARLIGNSISV